MTMKVITFQLKLGQGRKPEGLYHLPDSGGKKLSMAEKINEISIKQIYFCKTQRNFLRIALSAT